MRYFFHVGDGEAGLDRIGAELADDTAARIEVARLMGEMLRDDPEAVWARQELKITVTTARGLILFVLDLSTTEAASASQRRR